MQLYGKMSSDRSDATLLEAWRAGDLLAGNELVRRHFATVSRFFWNKVEEDATDDLVQATFAACVAKRDRLNDPDAFRAYVLGIARLELLEHLRKRGRRQRAMVVRERQPASSVVSPTGKLVREEEHKLLIVALRGMPVDLQIAVELYYWEGLPVAEVATVLGIPPGTVKSRLSRARDALRKAIEAIAGDDQVRESTMGALDRWVGSVRDLLGSDPGDSS